MTADKHESPDERAARYERGDFEISPNALIQDRSDLVEGDPDFKLDAADLTELDRLRSSLRGPSASDPPQRHQ